MVSVSEYRFSAQTAIAIIVANMIGTGVFVSLGFQLLELLLLLLEVLGFC